MVKDATMGKDCGRHNGFAPRERFVRGLCGCLLFFVIIVLFIILVVYLVLRPHKPRFYVQDATVRQWNVTDDGLLTSSLLFSVVSRNPNDRIGVYYDRINAYASYNGQEITSNCPLMPFYQGHEDTNILSVILGGDSVPLARFIADHLKYEEQNGVVTLNLRMEGKIRWKVGTWTSGHYHLHVNCYTLLAFNRCCNSAGQVPLQPGTRCDVDV